MDDDLRQEFDALLNEISSRKIISRSWLKEIHAKKQDIFNRQFDRVFDKYLLDANLLDE